MAESLRVALLTQVFWGDGRDARLATALTRAQRAGAAWAVLPELPLDPWVAVRREARADDAEDPGGARQRALERAARSSGIGVLGGAIVRDPHTGARHNTALAVSAAGDLLARYRKIHLPEEEGFWETSHYEPGSDPPEALDLDGFPVGLQVCSDVNRPQGAQLLAASGAEALLSPRATPPGTYERWRLVLRALAVTLAAYVISVNRPAEPGSPAAGASLAIGPTGDVLAEGVEPLTVVTLERARVARARGEYPGYLPFHPRVFAAGWARLAASAPMVTRAEPGGETD